MLLLSYNLCFYLSLNSNLEAQCHVRKGGTKTGWSSWLVKAVPGGDSVALSTQMATENQALVTFSMTLFDYFHAQHSSSQHWHLQHWNGTLWKPWHWTPTFRRALPMQTTSKCSSEQLLQSVVAEIHPWSWALQPGLRVCVSLTFQMVSWGDIPRKMGGQWSFN